MVKVDNLKLQINFLKRRRLPLYFFKLDFEGRKDAQVLGGSGVTGAAGAV